MQLPLRLQRDIELNLSEILPAYLADRLYLSVAVNTIHLAEFRGCRRLITIYEKFAAVSRGIWKNLPRKTVVPTHAPLITTLKNAVCLLIHSLIYSSIDVC